MYREKYLPIFPEFHVPPHPQPSEGTKNARMWKPKNWQTCSVRSVKSFTRCQKTNFVYFPEVSTVPLNTSQSLKNFSCSREILNTFSISDVAKEQQKIWHIKKRMRMRENEIILWETLATQKGGRITRGGTNRPIRGLCPQWRYNPNPGGDRGEKQLFA